MSALVKTRRLMQRYPGDDAAFSVLGENRTKPLALARLPFRHTCNSRVKRHENTHIQMLLGLGDIEKTFTAL